MIGGYSTHKIQAAALIFAFTLQLLHLPRSFYTCRAAFFTFITRILHFAVWLFNAGAGDPSQPPYNLDVKIIIHVSRVATA